jgi:ferredoxin
MALARSLDGVISGEHGIGITKLEFLTDDEMAAFRDYKQRVDPEGRFNRGKLMPGGDLRNAYTPSFGLMGAESLIMEQSDIGAIADDIKDCLRCGKCKPVCSTHVPRANLLYSPAQQDPRHLAADRGLPVRGADPARRVAPHWDEFERRRRPLHGLPQVREARARSTSTSATCRSRCATCCASRARRSSTPASRGDGLPERHRPDHHQARAQGMIDWGYKAQRLAHDLGKASSA